MFIVKCKNDGGMPSSLTVGRFFTEWEAQQVADDLNKVPGLGEYYVEEK